MILRTTQHFTSFLQYVATLPLPIIFAFGDPKHGQEKRGVWHKDSNPTLEK